jgi:hypothetical protein
MIKFNVAKRQPQELAEAKKTVDEMFLEAVRKGGVEGEKKFNRRGIEKIRAHEFDLAELITQIIQDQVVTTDPAPFLVNDVQSGLGDEHLWQELDASLRVVRRSPGSKPLSQRLTFKEYSITTTSHEIAVEIPLEEVAVGRITPSMVAEQVAAAVNRWQVSEVLDAIEAGVPAATADRTGVSGYTLRYSGITTGNLNKAIDGIMDESGVPVILGRHIAIAPALRTQVQADTQAFTQDMKREFETRGVVGQYNGAAIVTMRDDYSKLFGGHAVPANRVWVASGQKGAIRKTVDLAFLTWQETSAKDAVFGMGLRFEHGFLVNDPFRYRVLEA